jgi:diguanylate cyclase (GGDEF)-like protein
MGNMMKIKSAFVAPKVSPEKLRLLEKHLFAENIQRSKLFAKIVIFFEAILILMNVSSSFTQNQTLFEWNIYLVLYFVLLSMAGSMLAYMQWFEMKATYTDQQYKLFRMGLLSFVSCFLVWGSVVSLVDQKDYGHVMAFAVNFMCVSVLFRASNRTILSMYLLPILVLMVGLPIFQPSSAIVMGHYINLSVFLFFCWLASRMLYKSDSNNFFNKLLLTEINQRLASQIEENEKMNVELENANVRLKEMTVTDELTGISNRRGFHEFLKDTLAKSLDKQKLSIMMIDIDAFKSFNDYYGHLEGDRVIKIVAETIQNALPASGSITARFGGEEFVIALFDTDDHVAFQLAEQIRKGIILKEITHESSPVIKQVTISIGISSGFVDRMEDVLQLVKNADGALYQAKFNGRNRVEYDKLQLGPTT